jgi:hypothetical protein
MAGLLARMDRNNRLGRRKLVGEEGIGPAENGQAGRAEDDQDVSGATGVKHIEFTSKGVLEVQNRIKKSSPRCEKQYFYGCLRRSSQNVTS